jgi:hypothetical protein
VRENAERWRVCRGKKRDTCRMLGAMTNIVTGVVLFKGRGMWFIKEIMW